VDARRYLLLLPQEGGLLADTAAGGDLEAPVPACPGLTVGEVVRHTGSVYRVVLRWIQEGRRPDSWERQPPKGDGDDRAVVAWQRRGLAALVDELNAHAAEAACATWSSEDRTFGFWRRRMTHETAVHRVDVQAALGEHSGVDAELAVDGIDEVLRLWLGTRHNGGVGGDACEVQVRAGVRGWHVRLGADWVEVRAGIEVGIDAAAATADVSGPPAGLYLWLWGRRGDDAVTIAGDRRAAQTLRQALARATQ